MTEFFCQTFSGSVPSGAQQEERLQCVEQSLLFDAEHSITHYICACTRMYVVHDQSIFTHNNENKSDQSRHHFSLNTGH